MTPEELELLRAISNTEVETFVPAGQSAAQAKALGELVDLLEALKRLGWIELEVAARPGRDGKYQLTRRSRPLHGAGATGARATGEEWTTRSAIDFVSCETSSGRRSMPVHSCICWTGQGSVRL
jgi:hypothetical protein